MLSKQEIDEIKKNTDIVDVISRYVVLKKEGVNYKGLCPFHSENSPSFTVNPKKQIYKCFGGCGKGGDVINFLVTFGKSFSEAINEIKDPNNIAANVIGGYVKPDRNLPVIEWVAVTPPQPFQMPEIFHYDYGRPYNFWTYHDIDGNILGFTCRFNLPGGQKEVLPYSYCEHAGRYEWRWRGLQAPRPLFNLPALKLRPDYPVLLGEGEKTAQAMDKYYGSVYNCLTWIGGVDGVKNMDFTPLAGKSVLLWPDNDKEKIYKIGKLKGQIKPWDEQPGNKAMLMIADILRPLNCAVQWVSNPPLEPCGWDIADAVDVWTHDYANEYLNKNIVAVPARPPEQAEQTTKKQAPSDNFNQRSHSIEEYKEPKQPATPPPAGIIGTDGFSGNEFFRFLGYQKEGKGILFHFYSYKSKSIISLTPTAMSKPNLLQLAPSEWWETWFHGRRAGFELEPAQNWLINRSTEEKVFTTKWIRGRGAWVDGNDIVVHAGDRLIVNGNEKRFDQHRSKFIYEIGEELGIQTTKPLSTTGAKAFLDMLEMINWDRGINSYLLAGWCVIAPICGVLNWRPHIWLIGPAGSGKSWIFQKIVRRILGETALNVQGETSEPGLRQMLRHDALPVVFDEAEANDRRASDRIQDILGLMRGASTSDGGVIGKGTAHGSATSYIIRSVFAFASIGLQIVQQSDRTRITLLAVKESDKKNNPHQWRDLQEKYNKIFSDDFCASFRARSIKMIPIILKNAETFSNAAAAELGQQRAGDQVGAILAGAYSLRKNGLITYDEAIEFIRSKDWSEERSQTQTRDELGLIAHLMAQLTRVESTSGAQERTIGELVQTAAGLRRDDVLDNQSAQGRLNRIGIKTIGYQFIVIGNGFQEIKKMLQNTPYVNNYNKILMRLDGAIDMEPTRFASGVKIRAVKIPYRTIFPIEQTDAFSMDTVNTQGADIVENTTFASDDLPF